MRSLVTVCLLLVVAVAMQIENTAAETEDGDEEMSWNENKRRLLSQAFGKRGAFSQAFGKRGPFSQAFGKRGRGAFSQAFGKRGDMAGISEALGKRPKPFSQAFGKRDGDSADSEEY